jgi:preprotein translocase subunit SecG
MSFVAGVLTFLLVVNCVFLILLVLVQLPKKDAGAGMAFGAGTADALFGAGSGNTLTKITKYTAVVFLILPLVIGWMQSASRADNTATDFTRAVEQKQQLIAVPPPAKAPSPVTPAPASSVLASIPMVATNAMAPTGTNAGKPAK